MKYRPTHYEPHPVSPERKAELRALGLNIIDIKFAPPAARHVVPAPAAKARVTRKSTSQGVQ